MNLNIPFETALMFLVMAYVVSVIIVLLVSKIFLTVIETIESQ
jgi:hypothetical protein